MTSTCTTTPIIIAIDGFSSCGKSTMAKQLARRIGYIYIDSGAMYRAVTLYCIRQGLAENGRIQEEELKKRLPDIHIDFKLDPETGLPETWLNGENVEKEIRSMAVSDMVSPVSALGFVRRAMVRQQQMLGEKKGIVMDGRDIGTAVFPDAELKIFVTASPEIRAQRRMDEMQEKGIAVTFEEVLQNVEKRDYIDRHRDESPLRKAADALLLDNSHMTCEQQDQWLEDRFREVQAAITKCDGKN